MALTVVSGVVPAGRVEEIAEAEAVDGAGLETLADADAPLHPYAWELYLSKTY